MKHHLTYKDDKSDKFWQIETTGKSFIVTYGKTGSTGITQIKEFGTVVKCELEATKLLTGKKKKGYKESSRKSSSKPLTVSKPYQASWKEIASSNDIQQAFFKHFEILVDTNDERENLKNLSKVITGAKIIKEQLVFTFNDYEIEDDRFCSIFCNPPFEGKADKQVPASFKATAQLHNGIQYQSYGGGSIGFYGIDEKGNVKEHGGYESEYLEDCMDDELLDVLEENGMSAKDVKAIVGSGQNWILFDPFRQTSHKEPAYLYLGHGADTTVPIRKADNMKFGAFLLGVLSTFITKERVFDEISD